MPYKMIDLFAGCGGLEVTIASEPLWSDDEDDKD